MHYTPDDDKYKSKGPKPKEMTFTTTDQTNFRSISCHFCKSPDHRIYSCNAFKILEIDKKWDFVTKNSLCISCLSKFHNLKTCKRRQNCGISNCSRPHNRLLHKLDNQTPTKTKTTCAVKEIDNEKNCHINVSHNRVLLKIVPIQIEGTKKTIETYALLDEASTVSLIDQDLAEELGLDGPLKPLRLQWTNDQTNVQEHSKTVSLTIRGKFDNSQPFVLRHVKTISGLSLPTQTIDIESLSKTSPFLKNFSNLSFKDGRPKLLIGQDNCPVILNRLYM